MDYKPSDGNGSDKDKSFRNSIFDHNKKATNSVGAQEVKQNDQSGGSYVNKNKSHNDLLYNIIESLDDAIDDMKEYNEDPISDINSSEIDSENISDGFDDNDIPQEPTSNLNEDDLLNELNQIYTPILINQDLEGGVSGAAMESLTEAFKEIDSVLLENNIIKFDDASRMSQLRRICSKLIAKKQNSPHWETWKKSQQLADESDIAMQKENYAAASALAQKYLVSVSTTNNSSSARNAAKNLLPLTQH